MSSKTSQPAPILMTDKHKIIITQNFEDLTQNLTADNVLSYLVSEDIITINEHDSLLQEKEQTAKAGALLRLLLKKEDRTFDALTKACEKKGMKHIAKLLREADAKEESGETGSDAKLESPGDDCDGIVSVKHNGEIYEVEIETDGAIGLSTIGQVLPEGSKVRGLQFKHPATGKTRLVTLNEGRLVPPKNGWGRYEYTILVSQDSKQGPSKVQDDQSAKGKQEDTDEEDGPMTPEHRAILEKNKAALSYSMMPYGVMTHLRAMGVMTLQDQEDIKHGNGDSAQAAALVDFVLKKKDSAFEKLREALRLNNEEFLAKLLKA